MKSSDQSVARLGTLSSVDAGDIRSIIDAVEVDGHATRIIGRRDILKPPFSFQNASARVLSSFDRPSCHYKNRSLAGAGMGFPACAITEAIRQFQMIEDANLHLTMQ
jgi:hypothetical protein